MKHKVEVPDLVANYEPLSLIRKHPKLQEALLPVGTNTTGGSVPPANESTPNSSCNQSTPEESVIPLPRQCRLTQSDAEGLHR